ncbi:MAG TPA: hypothetical protein VGB70_02235 [Allosphingosinicella sp.]|jgi:hypothetical protein
MTMYRTAALFVLVSFAAAPAAGAIHGTCKFDSNTLRFAGSVADTAGCLLRRVKEQGAGAEAQPVPRWLLERIGRPVPFTANQIQSYLAREGIAVDQLTDRLAIGDKPAIRYFVIHDTSSPEIKSTGTTFPANINEAGWSGNRLGGWADVARKVNLIISRDGRSRRLVEWGARRPEPATKLEQTNKVPAARPVFVHVENIQPRIKPPNKWAWRAPTPGFGPAQERRLALAYIVASMRAGRWLIPAYHFNIDEGVGESHDDPQHADLAAWVAQLALLEAAILRGGSR